MKRSIFGFSCPLIKRKMFSANLIIEKKATVRVDRNRRQRRNEKKEPLGGPFSVCAQRINSSTSAWQRAVKAWTPRRARRRRSRGLNDSFSFLSGTNWNENQVSVHVTDRTLSLAHSLTLLLQLPKTREGGGDYANAEDIRGRRAIFRLACYQVRSLWIYMCGARSDNSWHDEGKKERAKLSSRCAKRKPNRFVEFTKKKAATATSTGRLNALDWGQKHERTRKKRHF